MKSKQNNIWSILSSSQKLNLIGSGLMIVSLFLNWFSDTDIFHSGDTYSGLSGPLYMVGITLFAVAVINIAVNLMMAMKWSLVKRLSESSAGKLQMMAGFGAMYLLLLVNSVYFSPQFGLNILNKRSEIGVMLTLVATVMICIGGYLAFRKKFEGMHSEIITEEIVPTAQPAMEQAVMPERTHTVNTIANKVVTERVVTTQSARTVAEPVSEPTPVANEDGSYFSERDPRGKTEYERTKLYENLRKTMLRDTMSPQQRKKERAQDTNRNAFSANFGKTAKANNVSVGEASKKAGRSEEVTQGKKPQMYRLDL